MKYYIIASLLVLSTCFPPATPASDSGENSASFHTEFLVQWVYNCMQAIVPSYERQGMPPQFAASMGMTHCSCVIDEFRKAFSQMEVISMSPQDRAAFGEGYAAQCIGVQKGT